jgi:hypothetical protein
VKPGAEWALVIWLDHAAGQLASLGVPMPAEPVVAAHADCVRALTFNVLSYDDIEADQRRHAAAARLRCERADVVALQETTLGAGTEEARELLGEDYRVLEHPARAADQVGSVLASRWPVRLVTEIDLGLLGPADSDSCAGFCRGVAS